MPFKSKSQLGVCYSRSSVGRPSVGRPSVGRPSVGRPSVGRPSTKKSSWNCDKWLKETPSVCCLPHKKGGTVKSRCMRNGERIVGKIQTGSRGGRFFTITEKDRRG